MQAEGAVNARIKVATNSSLVNKHQIHHAAAYCWVMTLVLVIGPSCRSPEDVNIQLQGLNFCLQPHTGNEN
jgi:hypothetical protein